MGVTDTAVKKAYKAGKISEGIVYPAGAQPYVLFEVARSEWAKNYDETYSARAPKLAKELGTSDAATPAPQAGSDLEGSAATGGNASLANAKRLQALLTVKKMEMDLRIRQGELVERRRVNDALFTAGKEIREAVMAIPDRYIDEIMASKTRAEGFNVLHAALTEALERIAGLPNRIDNV